MYAASVSTAFELYFHDGAAVYPKGLKELYDKEKFDIKAYAALKDKFVIAVSGRSPSSLPDDAVIGYWMGYENGDALIITRDSRVYAIGHELARQLQSQSQVFRLVPNADDKSWTLLPLSLPEVAN